MFILYLVSLIAFASAIPCPDGYFNGVDDACYAIRLASVNRYEAKRRCIAEGGDLAPMKNAFVNSQVAKLIASGVYVWIGNFFSSEGTCFSENGNVSTYSNVYPGSYGYDVFATLSGFNGFWYLNNNGFKNIDGYVCQIIPMNNLCPNNFYQSGDSCFSVVANPITWPQAQEFCGFFNAELASITSEIQNRFIVGLLRNKGFNNTYASIGLSKGNNDSTQFEWLDGTSVSYLNFNPSLPQFGDCVAMSVGGSLLESGTWVSTQCSIPNSAAICSTKIALPPRRQEINYPGYLPDVCRESFYVQSPFINESSSYLYSPFYEKTGASSSSVQDLTPNHCVVIYHFDSPRSINVDFQTLTFSGNQTYIELSGSLQASVNDIYRIEYNDVQNPSKHFMWNLKSNTLIFKFHSESGNYRFKVQVHS